MNRYRKGANVAFYAIGAYLFALLTSTHLTDNFGWVATMFRAGLHVPWWITLPLGAALAACFGILIGTPTLTLRGDSLAIGRVHCDHLP